MSNLKETISTCTNIIMQIHCKDLNLKQLARLLQEKYEFHSFTPCMVSTVYVEYFTKDYAYDQ